MALKKEKLLFSADQLPFPPTNCEAWPIVRHCTLARLGRCHVDYFLFFLPPQVINIYGTLVICDQRHRMSADEFPGNRKTN